MTSAGGPESRSWSIPLATGTARLELAPSIFGKSVTAKLSGSDIGRWVVPTLDHPWVEHPLSEFNDRVVVALISAADRPFEMRVFVDGRDLDDGASLEALRSLPRPRDRFEQAVAGWWFFSWYGALAFGLAIASPVLVGAITSSDAILAVAAGVTFAAGWLYWVGVTAFVRWLCDKTSWPVRLRIAGFYLFLVGSFAAALLLLQAVPTRR